ncbi:MAG TPA: penicillin-binding transpeptidase domain-containing protein, partial [Acidimicrobiales bacterium]|nr:penicillin-binding transpeptidase domain-containing protein [Acidimicrobiales bacterium]
MRARINGITVIIILAFALVLVQAVLLQVRRASALDRNALNERVIQQQNDYPRGEILSATGTVLARSIPTKDSFYRYRRSYPLGRLVSGIVGYVSTYYGTGGLESEYGQYLVAHQQTPTSITQLLSPVVAEDDVTLTLNVALQQVAARALDGRVGAVVALNPKTGSVLALYSNPTFNPIPLTSLNKKIQVAAWREDTTRDVFGYQPFNNVATGETYPPGSTFKVV